MSEAAASSTRRTFDHRRRVVVTGLGIVNPIGVTLEEFWESLQSRRSGIGPITLFDASALPVRFAGEVKNFNAKNYLEKKERKQLRVMSRPIQLAIAGAQLALQDSGVDKEKLDPTRFGVDFGAGLMATELDELAGAANVAGREPSGKVDLIKWGEQAISTIPPLWMLKYLPNMPACHISILHNAQGPNNSITEGEVGGLLAIGEALRTIQRNDADFYLAGGTDSRLNPLSMVRQCLFGLVSKRNDEPERACRPFDAQRDGLVVGEGAGVLAIEELGHAQSRGARIYAEVVGFGAAFAGTSRRGASGLARAIRAAMDEARIGPEALDHINAHGLATVASDNWEAKGIEAAFGTFAERIPVFAAKSYFGNLSSGGAPSELIASLLAMHHRVRPVTLNYEQPDPQCPLAVTREAVPTEKPYFLKISFTDMGQCAALVCRRWE